MSEQKRVLVVDDEPDVIVLCRVNLELEGFAVLTASNGPQALAVAAAERPDAMLLDVKLPLLDGWGVLERLQSEPVTADIPVILLTAYTMPSDQVRGWEAGAADYLTKPFNPSVLVAKVRGAVDGEGPGHARRRELARLGLASR